MKYPSMRQRILTAIPTRVAVQSVVALIIIRLIYQPRYFNWLYVLFISIAYGTVSTLVIQLYLDKYAKSLGLSSPWQLRNLADAVKRAEVPTDPTTRNALPAYLERRMRAVEQQRKSSTFAYVLFGFMFVVAIALHNVFEMAVFGLVVVLSVYANSYRKKAASNIKLLQDRLREQNVEISDKVKKESIQWSRGMSRVRRSAWLIGAILLLLALGVVFSARERNAGKYVAPAIGGVSPTPDVQTTHLASSKYGFTIDFPGKPSENDYSYEPNCNEDPIPYTLYTSALNSNTQINDLYVYAWPIHDGDFAHMSQPALKSALVNFLDSDIVMYGATLVDKVYEKRLPSGGALAEEGQFAENVTGGTVTGYVRVFTIGNLRYDIVSQGISRDDFDQFADSFRYTSRGSVDSPPDNQNGTTDAVCLNESTLSVP
ncbi:MAG TPA: hypothetical protein VFT53_01625 [Candidatus Saccharimonadales bacterium]|nr:hypothetical protein [Candidatus Saccharimonadales bacterium]